MGAEMTDKELRELRELDAWIAEQVFGWHKFKPHRINNAFCTVCRKESGEAVDHYNAAFVMVSTTLPRYSTDPAAAMLVLEKCAGRVGDTIRYRTLHGGHGLSCHELPFVVKAATLPLAICIFAKQLFSK